VEEEVMKHPPGARFGHSSIEHQMDIARRGWASEQRGNAPAAGQSGHGETVRSVAALIAGIAVMDVVVLLAWRSGVFSSL
jgi:hypothetical protein